MYYLVDGYNLIFSLTDSKVSLRTLRESLIRSLQEKFAEKNLSGTLVFDGAHKRDEESGLSYPSPLIVAYVPKGQSADEYILEKLEFSLTPKQIVIVTNDKELSRRAKGYSAKVLGNDEFISFLHKKKKKVIKEPKETKANFDRLLHIFEERFKENLDD